MRKEVNKLKIFTWVEKTRTIARTTLLKSLEAQRGCPVITLTQPVIGHSLNLKFKYNNTGNFTFLDRVAKDNQGHICHSRTILYHNILGCIWNQAGEFHNLWNHIKIIELIFKRIDYLFFFITFYKGNLNYLY